MKQYAIHGTAKGKSGFDHAPVAHVWAADDDDAKAKGELITRMNPIHTAHFGGGIEVREKK